MRANIFHMRMRYREFHKTTSLRVRRSRDHQPYDGAREEGAEGITDGQVVGYHLFGSPVQRPPTPADEADEKPAIIVVLADDSTLGQVLALRTNPIPTLARGGRPLPNTAAVRLWFRSLVQRAGSSAAMIVEPEVTQNPAFPENILLFHQLITFAERVQKQTIVQLHKCSMHGT